MSNVEMIKSETLPIDSKQLDFIDSGTSIDIVTSTENDQDIEAEDLDPRDISRHPFDPQMIKIVPETVNLGTIIENLENDEIDLSPAFQRQSDLWNNTHKSRLIESLILGLPLPTFFFANETKTNPDTGKEKLMLVVVDGLQRLCTIKEFVIDKTLVLSNLEFLSASHTGMSYDDLSREEQRKIKGSRITFSTILESNPPLVKYIVFRRINTGGLTLNQQEIRHALNQGIPAKFLNEMATSEEFIIATGAKIKTERMLDCEFVNRFLAFYILGYKENYSGDIDLFLADALVSLSKKNDTQVDDIKSAFKRAMKCAYSLFEEDTFRKPRTPLSPRKKAISKALFDCLSVNIAFVHETRMATLVQNKSQFLKQYEALFTNKEFIDSISNATGTQGHVYTRFETIRKLIQGILV